MAGCCDPEPEPEEKQETEQTAEQRDEQPREPARAGQPTPGKSWTPPPLRWNKA